MRKLLRALLRPESLFLLFSLTFGAVLLERTPPLEVPDEYNHFYRAYQVSEGVALPLKATGDVPNYETTEYGRTGGMLPANLREIEDPPDAPFPATARSVSQRLQRMSKTTIDPQKRAFLSFSNTALYSPLAYLPQAAGIFLARTFSRSLLVLFYAARMANLLVSVAVTWLAIRTLPAFKHLLVALALTPMAIFMMPTVSADALTNSVAFLFVAYLLRLACHGDARLTWREFLPLFFLAALLSWVKPGYATLALLYLGVPPQRLNGRLAYWLRFAQLLAVTALCGGAWACLVGPTYTPPSDSWYAPAKLQYIAGHPLFLGEYTLSIFWPSMIAYLVRQFVGCFAFFDTPLPLWFVGLHCLSLSAVAILLRLPPAQQFGLRLRLASGAVFLIGYWLLLLLVYISSTPAGSLQLFVQGRYLIPFGPAFFLSFAGVGRRLVTLPAARSRLVIVWICYLALSLSFVVSVINHRYAG